MSLHFEFKLIFRPADHYLELDPARGVGLARNNLQVTPTGSWATSAAATTAGDTAEMMVVTNVGTAAVRIAQSVDADPARFHIVLPGTQRAFEYRPNLPLKVRTL